MKLEEIFGLIDINRIKGISEQNHRKYEIDIKSVEFQALCNSLRVTGFNENPVIID